MFRPRGKLFRGNGKPPSVQIWHLFSGTRISALPQTRTAYADGMPKLFLCIIVFFAMLTAAQADPVRYRLQTSKSSVGFSFRVNSSQIKATMPVTSADIQIDFRTLANSKIQIVLNASKARTGFILATEAMRGKSVLDATNHPQISFVSTHISQTQNGAAIDGLITIKGITKPIRLAAQFYRQAGSPPKDRSRLVILLTGAVSRADFGASGYPNMVSDRIGLRIIVAITRAQ